MEPIDPKFQYSQFESTVINFVQNDKGCFVVLSEDQAFLSILRTVLSKYLFLKLNKQFTQVQHPDQLMKALDVEVNAMHRPLLFMEQTMDGENLSARVKEIKDKYPNVLVIMLLLDFERHKVIYLHEVGVDNFIAKPVSAKTVIEKLAFTLQPQTKLGQTIDQAKLYLQTGELDKARQEIVKVLQLKPGSPAGYMLMGDAQLAVGDVKGAKTAYATAAENADLYLEPLHKLAQLSKKVGELGESLTYMKKLDFLSPLNSERKVDIGELHLAMGNNMEAQLMFEAAVDIGTKESRERFDAIAARITEVYADKEPARAEIILRKVLGARKKLGKDDIKYFNQLGISLRQQGKWEQAIEEYKRALEIAPNDESLRYNLGMAYADGQQFFESLNSILAALNINANFGRESARINYNIGYVFFKSNRLDEAKQYLQTALKIDPRLNSAKEILAKL